MNLPPPPRPDKVEDLQTWLELLYEHLKYLAVHQIRVVPRSSEGTTDEEGRLYWDEDNHVLKAYNGTEEKTISFD